MRTIIFYVPNIMPGGAERVSVNLANYISTNQDANVYLMTKFGGHYDSLVCEKVKRIDIHNYSFLSLLVFLKNLKPDVVMSTLASANLRLVIIKMFLTTKTLYVTRSPAVCQKWNTYSTFKEKILFFFSNKAYNYSDFVIANSPDTAKSLFEQCKVSRNKIYTIGNPVISINEINYISDEKVNQGNYILAVGSFKPIKRYDLMLDMFKIVSEYSKSDLYIIGGGKLEQDIKIKIKNLGIGDRVHLLGIKSNLVDYYRGAKCFVLCSEKEGFGNVIVEAMAQGLVPVCFDCPGGPKYILENGKYGELVPFGDVKAMAERVINIINKKIVYDKETLIKRAEFFTIEVKALEYFELFSKLYYLKYKELF